MKKLLSILLSLVAAMGVFSCQTEKDADGSQYLPGPALEIVSKDVIFTPQGGSGSIVVNTQETLTAVTDRPWAVLSVSGNRVTVTVNRNESLESRYATIQLFAGTATAEIQAQQFGINSAHAWDDTYTFPYGGGELDLPYAENGTVWVDVSEVDWIMAVVDQENHLIHFTVSKNLYNVERVGHVTVTIGDDYARDITFVQAKNPTGMTPGGQEPITFTVESAWKPYYVVPQSNDQAYSTVGVEVAEGSHAGRYFIKVLPASEFNTADPDDVQIYLNRHASEWAAASPQIHRASAEENIDRLGNGTYVVGAIGVDNDNKVNGSVAFTVFNVTRVLTPYEKFLGTWSYDRNGTEDIWTVTEKVPNKSYNVTGFDGNTTITAEALFNADGTVTLNAQGDLGENTVSTSSGDLTGQAGLYGRILYNGSEYYVTGNYTIFTATFNADASEAALAPGTVNLSVGQFELIGFALYTTVGSSAYATTNKGNLPATIKHLTQGSGSGDNPGDDPGDDPGTGGDYAKWLGSWNVGDVTLTVSQKVKDKTYTVSGLEGYDFEARYKDGKMEFFFQVVYEEDPYEVCLFGIDDDGDGYIVEGDPANDDLLATATLNAAGTSASLVGAEYDAVYSGTTYHERIVQLLILAYNTETSQFYYASNDPKQINMPTTMTKSSSSSVLSLRSAGIDLERGIFVPAYTSFHNGPAVPFKSK